MNRTLLFATAISILVVAETSDRAGAETVMPVDVGALMSGGTTQRRTVRRYEPAPRGDYFVGDNDRFPGSYYVENGSYYFQPAASQGGGKRTIVRRGDRAHMADLADRLEYEVRTMCRDMANNYRQSPNYREMYREAYRIWELTKDVQETGAYCDPGRISGMVRDLDSRFERVRCEVSNWNSKVGGPGAAGNLQARLDRAEALIQHLRNDAGPVKNTWVARSDSFAPVLRSADNGSSTIVR